MKSMMSEWSGPQDIKGQVQRRKSNKMYDRKQLPRLWQSLSSVFAAGAREIYSPSTTTSPPIQGSNTRPSRNWLGWVVSSTALGETRTSHITLFLRVVKISVLTQPELGRIDPTRYRELTRPSLTESGPIRGLGFKPDQKRKWTRKRTHRLCSRSWAPPSLSLPSAAVVRLAARSRRRGNTPPLFSLSGSPQYLSLLCSLPRSLSYPISLLCSLYLVSSLQLSPSL